MGCYSGADWTVVVVGRGCDSGSLGLDLCVDSVGEDACSLAADWGGEDVSV